MGTRVGRSRSKSAKNEGTDNRYTVSLDIRNPRLRSRSIGSILNGDPVIQAQGEVSVYEQFMRLSQNMDGRNRNIVVDCEDVREGLVAFQPAPVRT